MNARELRARREEVLGQAGAIVEAAEAEDRDFTEDEQVTYGDYLAEAETLRARIVRIEQQPAPIPAPEDRQAPGQLRIGRGDTEARAICHWIRTGDDGGLGELRASNAVNMQVGTAGEGGNAVPTGHYQGIIARRDEVALTTKLGCMQIPGKGTTVNVPYDNEADGEFVATNEESDHDLDSPDLGKKAMTLLRYTKKIGISWELLEDEDSRLLAFLENWVGRGMAKTDNSLLLTEVASNGTALKTFASATAIAVDELEAIVYNDDLSFYLEDSGSVAWVMKPSVHGEIVLLDDANTRRYAANQMGGPGPNLLGFPIAYSNKSGATAASTKSVYFGNWRYVGYREGGMMTFLRDPYSYEGGIELRYQYRKVYGVLQAEAIGYGVHPSA